MSSSDNRWYEFSDPDNSISAFVNLKSKQYAYDLPPNVELARDSRGQFLEIFDELTGKYYYVDTKAKLSSWKKPEKGVILPASLVQVSLLSSM